MRRPCGDPFGALWLSTAWNCIQFLHRLALYFVLYSTVYCASLQSLCKAYVISQPALFARALWFPLCCTIFCFVSCFIYFHCILLYIILYIILYIRYYIFLIYAASYPISSCISVMLYFPLFCVVFEFIFFLFIESIFLSTTLPAEPKHTSAATMNASHQTK